MCIVIFVLFAAVFASGKFFLNVKNKRELNPGAIANVWLVMAAFCWCLFYYLKNK